MNEPKRAPGRPKVLDDAERRKRIVEVAGRLFVEEGFEATDMKRIAEGAGMSKKTVYRMFENKEDLFSTLLCDPEHIGFRPAEASTAAPRQALIDALVQLAEWVLDPRQVGLTRLVIAEAQKRPDLAADFRASAVDVGHQMIQARLADLPGGALGERALADLASILFGSVIGDLQLRALAGEDISAARQRGQIRARAIQSIDLFAPAADGEPAGSASR